MPFPFSDLTSAKKRPALVISNTEFNKKSEDVICCLITSNPAAAGIKITNKDMESGFLEFSSKVKPYRLFTTSKNIIYKVLGRLNKDKARLVSGEISKLIEIS